jgi:succinate dehydrogenase / fumarate reductase cytochrome b subunit
MTGMVILAFIVFHLMHFTFRVTHPEISNSLDEHGHRDVFKMVVMSFQRPELAFGYVAALTLLFLHLSHGLWSMFQSLGLLGERTLPIAKKISFAVAFVLYLTYISIPLTCYFGVIKA